MSVRRFGLPMRVAAAVACVAAFAACKPTQGTPPPASGDPTALPSASATVAEPETPEPPVTQPETPAGPVAGRPFSADSPWNTKIGANAALDPANSALISDLAESGAMSGEDRRYLNVNLTDFSVPVFQAKANTPLVTVRSEVGGTGFPGENGMNGVAQVPVPADAAPDPKSDHHMVVLSADGKKAWDFWNARKSADGSWDCGLCAVSDLTGTGVRPAKEGNATWYTSHGSRACGMPLSAGLITPAEVKSGRIDHALVIAYPHIKAGLYTAPASTAQAKMQTNEIEAIKSRGMPCGQRVQLDPSLNLDSLGLTPAGKVIAKALQEYGAIIGDASGAISIYAQNDPAAKKEWSSVLTDDALRGKVKLTSFRALKSGPVYDDHNG